MTPLGAVSRSAMLVTAAIAAGTAVGIGAFTFVYAKGASYLSTEPAVCANCHIMGEHFDAWQRSSHRTAAGCADWCRRRRSRPRGPPRTGRSGLEVRPQSSRDLVACARGAVLEGWAKPHQPIVRVRAITAPPSW